jgi:hypothetical protein
MNSSDGTSPPSSDSGHVGPIRTGQAVPGPVTYGQRAIRSATRAARKREARFGKEREGMVPSSTLVPIEEPIPVPDPTPLLVPGVRAMSIESNPVAGPSTVVPVVAADSPPETPRPTPDSPPYDPFSWENARREVGNWDRVLNPCADMYALDYQYFAEKEARNLARFENSEPESD